MSTPTTATATLPHTYHHHHSHHYPFHQPPYQPSYQPPAPPPPYRPAPAGHDSAALPGAGRLAAGYPAPAAAYAPSSAASSAGYPARDFPDTSSTTSARSLLYDRYPRPGSSYSATMPAYSPAASDTRASRKRRRSREPDWNKFYQNGLPKEIIVIDDDEPEPAVVPVASAGTAAPQLPAPHVNGLSQTAGPNGSDPRPLSKRRKRDDDPGHYDPVYNRVVGSQTHTQVAAAPTATAASSAISVPSANGHPHTTSTNGYRRPSGSTISSSSRTGSAIHTTAPTPLTSLSSAGGHFDESQAGHKRKRTRQQLADEAKRKEAALFGPAAYASYCPPPNPPKKAGEVHVRVVPDNHGKVTKVDDEDGHYIVVPEAPLTDRYQMVKLLGQGTFGKVVQARDTRRNELVAVKIIRSVQKYRDASRIELRVLATLKANDAENRNRCIHLRDCFDYRGHICIVMDLLGQSVFDFLKGNNFVPFPNSQIQSFARQLFTSVAFLHDLHLIHTDLKPENILLADNQYQTFTYSRKIPSSSTTVSRQATQRRVLLDTEIRLIDFGSATFQEEYHSSVVSTRHYRAPEIILGLGWSYPCDIWSIGCILVEFFTGDALFQTHDNLEHLAMMEAVCNARIDSHLVQAINKSTRSGGNPASKYFKRLKLDYPNPDTTRASRRFVKAMKKLDEIIPSTNTFLRNFLDLLKRIFIYDPDRRITAKEALKHPWFQETAHPDDGTEAAKIRMERMRASSHHTTSSHHTPNSRAAR